MKKQRLQATKCRESLASGWSCHWVFVIPGLCVAEPILIKPYKDKLFSYPAILSKSDSGSFLKVDYSKERDLHGRDQIPERRAKGKYVSMGPKRKQRVLTIKAPDVAV